MLAGYIDYISALVVKESIENVRNKLEIKTQFEKRKNWLRIALKRKINLMQTFSASIIHSTLPTRQELKKPVYSNGQAVKDDPRFLYFSRRRRY